jgi:hypothetical protein
MIASNNMGKNKKSYCKDKSFAGGALLVVSYELRVMEQEF